MHKDLTTRWGLLPLGAEASVFQLFDKSHPLKFYIGKSIEGHQLLMLVLRDCPPKVKSMRAINIKSYSREDETWAFVLTLENSILEPMFSLLCADLIGFSNKYFGSEDEALVSILRRLSYWRLLLERESFNLLNEFEIRGLCGELLFLQRQLKKLDAISALRSWVGPFDAPQDFQSDDCCWEIKTIRPSAGNILISSEFQLQVYKSPIFLELIELVELVNSDNEESFTLNSLVEIIRLLLHHNIDASDLFEERLSLTGYAPRDEYDEYRYYVGSTSTYEVIAGFPCLTSEMLAPGIINVRYEINISDCEKYRITPESSN